LHFANDLLVTRPNEHEEFMIEHHLIGGSVWVQLTDNVSDDPELMQ